METQKKHREHLANFHIAGLTYYEATSCFKKLKIGTKLRMELEEDNKYDPRAVAIYYKGFKLGFVPRTENRFFYKLLKTNNHDIIDLHIQQIDPTEHPEQQIRVVAHLTEK
ncbi:HIRAN domain-containing protein [Riemerella columbipharyngis]|uniref:HIRAN domain-containing protein n=1 Tax=Riemerella columbipharyngis TaxID=1071918 RepID=A0A1G7DTM1_9FLAO|nr:HIRAN domain-containing protein [Riemerella columbipharyngis]SDE54833.1 HIRAN domain-containing protein [Riemerella columbipharyngis]